MASAATNLILAATAFMVASASSAKLPDYSVEREQYEQARKALRRGDYKQFDRLHRLLLNYPLQPYLQFEDLTRRLDRADASEVRAFIKRNANSPLAGRLRSQWLRQLGKQKRWTDYLADYTPQRAADLRCYFYRARLQRGQHANYDSASKDLWLTGKSQHDSCDILFDHWRRNGALNETAHGDRAELAVQAGNPKLARYLARSLPAWRRNEIERWIALRARPDKQFRAARAWKDTEFHRRILTHELVRRASKANQKARGWWRGVAANFAWSEQQRAQIAGQLALFYATDYPADALSVLQKLPPAAQTEQIKEWTARVAIREGNWTAVETAIAQLAPENRNKARWRYWLTQAQLARGDHAGAQSSLATLAGETNFHGFLAADQLGLPYTICPSNTALTDAALLASQPTLVRAFELFRVGDLANARREWNGLVRTMEPATRIQAALLAADQGWHNRAILTLADEGRLKEYEARFPLAWSTLFNARAEKENLDPSFVIAVARSESALMTDAVSSAGARGLMQLTPSTGKRVAKANRWRRPSNWDLLQPQTNIRLGTAYLDDLFRRYEHPLLVLGAYNAGPHVVDRWQKMDLPQQADRWIETLPYHETRDYIARVLAFTTIYDWRRTGAMQRLAARMPAMRDKVPRFQPTAATTVNPVCRARRVATTR